MTNWVYGFDEVEAAESLCDGDWDAVRGLLGGKGANLGDMTRIGVPVPPGFTITTAACNKYLESGAALPPDLLDQVSSALKKIEEASDKRFGDTTNPLLVSCRSGAKFSMPGMMDTVLNIGLNDSVVKGLIALTNDPHFVYDSYRRLVQMFGAVVLGVRDEPFEAVLSAYRHERNVVEDSDLAAEDLKAITAEFKAIVERFSGRPFPDDPFEQLRLAIEAVFRSWDGKRARDYRNAANIPHDLGTAVNIQTMVFGNMGSDSATGVAMSRNATTGEAGLEGDYLTNAQGEDVVAGIRATKPMSDLETEMPELSEQFASIALSLERHYRDMQDMEFTIERGVLWILQTRNGKRTAQAAVKIAVDMAEEGLIDRNEAVQRISPEQVEFFLHPSFTPASKQEALDAGHHLTTALNVSPGAAVGVIAFDADLASEWAESGKQVVMVRPETKPDDVHGMLASQGILTTRGGRTSHAALVARQFGKPAVVGANDIDIDLSERIMTVGNTILSEGEWISLDGTTGEVFAGKLETRTPDLKNPALRKLLEWADDVRDIGVWANADHPADAELARSYGAQGIGLVRTEHMFFDPDRLPIVQRMIMATSPSERTEALDQLLPFQRRDFAGLFRAMDGLPVTIRLIDPPLHEFLPSYEEITEDLADLKIQLLSARSLPEVDQLLTRVEAAEHLLHEVEALREANPMLGLRGVRLGLMMPALTRMQVRAIFEAAISVQRTGVTVHPKIMIPLVAHVNELARQRASLEEEAANVMHEEGVEINYEFGTMIEIPRAALTARQIAEYAQFISFGTNDLTQMTYGISRDDAEKAFLVKYLEEGILDRNPFASIDEDGVGRLMRIAVKEGRKARPGLEAGICGEHGGDPASIAFCRTLGLDYVSCSPPRVPVARLAAAQAALNDEVPADLAEMAVPV
ncbi:MAG: pyruvate, phosphate dikinase [Acidimicrobiia bacterium]|nr:pyruvate, phosphate dikinase [Acidimicrobiia bacterium]MDH5503369.1 pyruvate, phosphate dikinase [Acidimicrobiia bacterium]